MTLQRRVRTIVVPTSRREFNRLLAARLSGMVMSRTRVDGQPIRRELELLDEGVARNSVEACYRRIASLHGTAIEITFILHRDENGVVTRVLVEPPPERPRPPRIDNPPEFLRYNSRIDYLKGHIRRLQEEVAHATRRLQEYQFTASDYGSRQYERRPQTREDRNNDDAQELGEALAGGPPTGVGHFAENYRDQLTVEAAEESIRHQERVIEGINRQLDDLNAELRTLEREQNNFGRRSRRPGPQGGDAAH